MIPVVAMAPVAAVPALWQVKAILLFIVKKAAQAINKKAGIVASNPGSKQGLGNWQIGETITTCLPYY
jgi:hypothetical protein